MTPASSPTNRHAERLTSPNSRGERGRPRRILIECTPTFRHDCGTGVQRVVRNIVNHAALVGRELGIECHGVAHDPTYGFQIVGAMPPKPHATPVSAVSVADVPPASLRTLPLLKGALRRSLAATGLLVPARQAKRVVDRTLASARKAVDRKRREAASVQPGPGDVLLLTDTIWNTPDVWDGVNWACARGATLGAIIYDLIPLHFAELYGPSMEAIFGQWFRNVATKAEFAVCISRSTWEDVESYLAARGGLGRRGPALAGSWFRLGEGLEARGDQGPVRPQLRELFTPGNPRGDNPYLIVGSFDPRKDLVTVVKAFEQLWSARGKARLVVIGRGSPGQITPLERMVFDHPQFGRGLFCFPDVEDAELDFCYRNSAALVTASYAEGFNLPIVESLGRGRGVLASDIPVHREVAGANAAYFTPRAPESLTSLIQRHQAGELGDLAARVDDFRWPDWHQSSRELLENILKLYSASPVSSHTQAA